MPPTRRSRTSGGPVPKGTQRSLSFNHQSKVTKPSTPSAKDKPSVSPSTTSISPSTTIPTPAAVIDVGHVSSEAAVAQQAAAELHKQEQDRTAEERLAAQVTPAQIQAYWRARENERRTPRVHQEGLSTEEKILRFWDMSSQYGPAIGIARMKRWVRANKLGLQPPIEVLAVLLKEEAKGNSKIERAHVDELMSSKFVIGDA